MALPSLIASGPWHGTAKTHRWWLIKYICSRGSDVPLLYVQSHFPFLVQQVSRGNTAFVFPCMWPTTVVFYLICTSIFCTWQIKWRLQEMMHFNLQPGLEIVTSHQSHPGKICKWLVDLPHSLAKKHKGDLLTSCLKLNIHQLFGWWTKKLIFHLASTQLMLDFWA